MAGTRCPRPEMCSWFPGDLGMARLISAFIALVLAAMAPAAAQEWPTRALTVVVPYGPGSGSDVLARIITPRVSELLGQAVIIENVAGAGGVVGSARVARAAPDGYLSVIGTASTHSQIQFMNKDPPYQPADFAPVVLVADQPFALIVRKDLPVESLQQFIAHAKANPGSLKYGSPGKGSAGHLACALLNHVSGADAVHVPYRGAAQAMTDLISGVLDYQCAVLSVILSQAGGNTIKPIALLAPERSPFVKDLPSSAEQGLPDFDASTWNALFLPKATPAAIVSKLNRAMVSAMQSPAVLDRLRSMGAEPPSVERSTPEYLARLIEQDMKRWAGPIRAANVTVE